MRRHDLTGCGQVFRFTLTQYLKSRAVILTMLLMVAVAVGSVFIAGFSMSPAAPAAAGSVSIINRTGIAISADDIAACDPGFYGLTEAAQDSADATLTIELTDYGCQVTAAGDFDEDTLRSLEDAALTALSFAQAGTDVYSGNAMTLEDYLYPETGEDDFAADFTLAYVYAVIVLMLVMISSTYIIRSVLEEKASRLVETLLISVRPLALIVGKILASMCLVVMQIALLIGGGALAGYLISRFAGGARLTQMVTATGVGGLLEGLDLFSGIAAIISVFLGFLTFSLIGGLSASCCDTMEDMNSANTATVFVALGGYLVSIVASGIEGVAGKVCALIPVVSVFAAPVKFMQGDIGVGLLLAAWILQLAVIAALAVICKRTYAALIMHTGSRVRLSGVMRMAGKGGAK